MPSALEPILRRRAAPQGDGEARKDPLLDGDRLHRLMNTWRFDSGNRLRQRRIALDWSQEMLASLVGVQPISISRFETGVQVPRDNTRLSIACALNCEVNDIWPPLDTRYVMSVARMVVAA